MLILGRYIYCCGDHGPSVLVICITAAESCFLVWTMSFTNTPEDFYTCLHCRWNARVPSTLLPEHKMSEACILLYCRIENVWWSTIWLVYNRSLLLQSTTPNNSSNVSYLLVIRGAVTWPTNCKLVLHMLVLLPTSYACKWDLSLVKAEPQPWQGCYVVTLHSPYTKPSWSHLGA